MAGKSPRAKVRLRLDRGTVLLRQFGLTSITCTIIDLSESGCQCRFSMEELDEETASAWRQILAPGRVLSIELTEPPELRNLIFRDAQIRWVKAAKAGDLDFGMQFSNVDDFQRNTLNQAMMTFASEKLRAKKANEALTKTSGKPLASPAIPTPPPQPKRPLSATEAAVSAFTLSADNDIEKAPPDFRTASGQHARLPSGTHDRTTTASQVPLASTGMHPRPARPGTGHFPPVAPPGPTGSGMHAKPAKPGTGQFAPVTAEAGGRQKRQNAYMSALFEFCDIQGNQWEDGMHQGRTIDFSEGGFKIEGPAPDCCEAEELTVREAHAKVIIRSTSEEVKCLCRVRNVEESKNMRGFWLYGMQILTMTDSDRKQLREMYIRAGFAQIRKR